MRARRRVMGVLSPPMPGLRSAPAFDQPKPTVRELPMVAAQAVLRHRRVVATGCVALAVAIALTSLTPAKPATVRVVAAAHDLGAGAVLKPDDVRLVALPVAAEPAGALTAISDAVGHAAVGAIRSGEAITDVRLDGGSAGGPADAPLAPPGDGLVATPVRLADVEAAALLRAGERVDVLAATPPSSGSAGSMTSATVVADDVKVVSAPASPNRASSALDSAGGNGALVVLATTRDQARALAQAQLTARLSAVVVQEATR